MLNFYDYHAIGLHVQLTCCVLKTQGRDSSANNCNEMKSNNCTPSILILQVAKFIHAKVDASFK